MMTLLQNGVLLRSLLVVALVGICRAASFSGTPLLNTANPPLFSKLEISFSLGASYSNAYDSNEIDVSVKFSSSNGNTSYIPCFPFQAYTTTSSNNWSPSGAMKWLCRFAPMQVGDYKFTISAKDSASTATSSGTFTAVTSELPGFIHRSALDNKYLVRSHNKETFFAIGENIAWWNNGIHDYDGWVKSVSSAGGNYMRIWIGATGFGFYIEGKLGNYDSTQELAAKLDYLLDMAASQRVTILICIDFHGDFSTNVNSNWAKNPYNQQNGGPLSNPSQVWTNTEAIKLFERRYRYIIARWAYSTAVHSWELWNEMDWIDNFANSANQAGAWHSHFYSLIHTLDPFGHTITTSFAEDKNNQPVDSVVDFTQIHQYSVNDFVSSVQGYIPSKVSQYKKPSYFGEMGVSWESGQSSEQLDPTGISLHNVEWASLVFGAAGGGFSWWWDSYIQPKNLYYHFTGISKFLAGETLDTHDYNPVEISSSNSGLRAYALSGRDGRVLGWVQSKAHTWSNVHNGGGQPTISGATLKVPCTNSSNAVEIWNTVSGVRLGLTYVTCSGGSYSLAVPTINSQNPDYAFKLYNSGHNTGTATTLTSGTLTTTTGSTTGSNLPDWDFCTSSSQCQDGCCSKQYSNDGKYKCTPGGSKDQCI